MKKKKKMKTAEELFGVTFTVDPTMGKGPHKPSSTLKKLNEMLKLPSNFEEVFGFKPTRRQ